MYPSSDPELAVSPKSPISFLSEKLPVQTISSAQGCSLPLGDRRFQAFQECELGNAAACTEGSGAPGPQTDVCDSTQATEPWLLLFPLVSFSLKSIIFLECPGAGHGGRALR